MVLVFALLQVGNSEIAKINVLNFGPKSANFFLKSEETTKLAEFCISDTGRFILVYFNHISDKQNGMKIIIMWF